MMHRNFLKLVLGFGLSVALGASVLVGAADAAPVSPAPLVKAMSAPASTDIRPAVTSAAEVDQLQPQQVRWGHHSHHRHWGGYRHHWHRHHWHRHHWGHRHFHRHHWRHW
jgi:hypothetical protein